MGKRYILSTILWLLIFSIIISCKNSKQHKEKINTLETVVNSVLNKKLYIPDSLETYSPFSDYIANEKDILNAEYKIYSKINGSCGTCIGHINAWNELRL